MTDPAADALQADLQRAAEMISAARAVVVAAGAGMGVDSGLPDFRGTEGFWRAYPPIAKLGLRFQEMANPKWFERDPALAWGFYGHRMNLYQATVPHRGFTILRNSPQPKFVFTSNIDGHFQKAGFAEEQVLECHGSIRFLQCTQSRCPSEIHPVGSLAVNVDLETMRAKEPLPQCPECGMLARPNVLMFNDHGWDSARANVQQERLEAFCAEHAVGGRFGGFVVVEIGAGEAVPTVRHFSEQLLQAKASLVRINLRESDVPRSPRAIGLPMGGLAALERLETLLVDIRDAA